MVEDLRGAALPPAVIMDAEIVIGELVSNAHEHGRPDEDGNIEISWCVHDHTLRISVFDGGNVDQLTAQPLDPSSYRGRGLAMVDFICDNWRTEHERPGTRVTAELKY
jgi:anti-sigma regulatory factor (Ser/Thr protein kinase)